MAQPETERYAVPRRVDLAAQQAVNPSGSVTSLTPRLTLSPIGLTLGSGFGVIALNSNPSPMAFASPSAGYAYSGQRNDVFANGAIIAIPETGSSGGMVFSTFGAGGTCEVGREAGGITVRAGADFSSFQARLPDSPVVGAGVGVSNDRFSVHAIIRGVIVPSTVHHQMLWERFPNFHQVRSGASIGVSRGTEVSAEVIHSPGEVAGRAAVSFSGSVPVTAQAMYTERNPVFGAEHELLAAITVRTDNPRSIPTTMTAQAVLGQRASPPFSVAQRGDEADVRGRLAANQSLEALAGTYSNASVEDKVRAASALAYIAMMQVDRSQLTASPLARYPGKGQAVRETYSAVRGNLSGPSGQSAGACAEISSLTSEFLRLMGVEAYAASMSLQGAGHTVTVALDRNSGQAYSIDYDRILRVPRPDIQSALSAYGQDRGQIIASATVYGEGNRFVRHFVTDEGRLVQSAMTGRGTQDDALRDSLTRRRAVR